MVKGLKDRLRHKFNVSVAEIAHQESWQRSTVAVVTVSSDRKFAEQVLQAAERDAADIAGPDLASSDIEWID